MVRVLLQHGADVNRLTEDGRTPLVDFITNEKTNTCSNNSISIVLNDRSNYYITNHYLKGG